MRRIFEVFKEAATRWADDKCYRLGASLAYYALFSLFPLVLLLVTVFGFVVGSGDAARQHVLASLDPGTPEGRALLEQTLSAMQEHRTARGVGAAVGFVTLLFGASGVFSELDTTLNLVWRCKEKETSGVVATVLATVRDKAVSMLLVGVAGLVLLASLVTSTALAALNDSAQSVLPSAWVWRLVEAGVSATFLTAIFGAMFRYVPSCRPTWRDVLPAALFTALAFTGLKHLLAWYLGHVGSYAAYGAVGAVLGLMTWIYIVSLVLFFGAELSRAWAERIGSRAKRSARGEDARHEVDGGRHEPRHGAHAHSMP